MSSPEAYPFLNPTYVFIDVESSSRITAQLEGQGHRLYETHLSEPHRSRIQDLLALLPKERVRLVQLVGDGHMIAFQFANDALTFAVALQQSLTQPQTSIRYSAGGVTHTLCVRIGVHTAVQQREPQRMNNDLAAIEYPGSDTNFASRIMSLGAGGQIIMSEETTRVTANLAGCRYHPWPNRYLKSFEETPHVVYEILYFDDQVPREPGIRFFPEFYGGDLNHYIQREAAQEAVFRQFRNKRQDGTTSRLVTLKAEGGMGKTRLAIACAVRMVGLFDGHTHFVNLESSSPSVEAVAQAIGQAMHPPIEPATPEAVFQALRERGSKRTLFVLDNYESVQNESVAHYLTKLVTQTQGVHLLITGRTPVGVSNVEQWVSLDEGMTEGEARELFIARARLRAGAGWAPSEAEEPHLARLLKLTSVEPESERVCAIPLAIELVAAWVGVLTLREIADGLDQTTLGEISALPPDAVTIGPERHASLERSFRWSYDLLGRQAEGVRLQRTFAASALFANSFDAATLAVVTQGDTARTDLIRLHNASLVRRLESDDQTRYYLHRFSRAFAASRLQEVPDVDDVECQFLSHYFELVQHHTKRLQLADTASRTLLDREWKNALSALSIAERTEEVFIASLFYALGQFFEFRGLYIEWQGLMERCWNAVEKAQEFADERLGEDISITEVKGGILSARGLIHMGARRPAEALKCFEKAEQICRANARSHAIGVILHNMGEAYAELGETNKAIEVGKRALAVWRDLQKDADDLEIKRDHRRSEGQTLHDLARMYGLSGEHDKAMRLLKVSLEIRRECGDRLGESRTLATLAEGLLAGEDWDDASAMFREALVLSRELGDVMGELSTMNELARVRMMTGQFVSALILAREVVARLESTQAVVELEGARALVDTLEDMVGKGATTSICFRSPFTYNNELIVLFL